MIKAYYRKGKKQKRIVILGAIIVIGLLFFLRDDYQPALLFLRKYIFIILLGIGFLWLTLTKFRSAASAGKRILILVGITAFFATLWSSGGS